MNSWHSRSLASSFPTAKDNWRVCKTAYIMKAPNTSTTLFVMALQPTKRGAWCRVDRKKRQGIILILYLCKLWCVYVRVCDSNISVHLNITIIIILTFQILSYRPGDLSIIIIKLHAASGALLSVVASSLEGS